MNLYLIEDTWTYDHGINIYDVYDAHVIRAESPHAVREMAAERADGEAPEAWIDPDKSTITLLSSDVPGDQKIILSSYNAG